MADRILITGASGLLGSMLAFTLAGHAEVLACTHRAQVSSGAFETTTFDLSDAQKTRAIVEAFHPRWICHCAAMTSVDECERRPDLAWRLNVAATAAIADAGEHVGSALLYVSTDSVFDGRRGFYDENDQAHPLNAYARTKLAGEHAAQTRNQRALIVRTNFYGFNVQPKLSFSEWVYNKLSRGEIVPGWTDVFFSPLFSATVATSIKFLMDNECRGTFHLGSSERISKYDLAIRLAALWQLPERHVVRTSIYEADLVAPRPLDTSLNIEKAVKAGLTLPQIEDDLVAMGTWSRAHGSDFSKLYMKG